MTAIYNSSSGPKVIADMNPHNLAAAHAKLQRDYPAREDLDGQSLRQAEIDAMGARLAVLAEEYAESQVSE
ncbi:hypothetical protein [Phenylobacterium sp.]|uniref:hypothetical protein n=1 Tax=Phenylobacterium sp. TaxID=1871053 RepID=UPI002718315D|nr:hypothetical protein [Phenylobacterium sp.]MDO8800092.1 hypothetical protein [Phenylobacterium sp.]